MRLALAWGVFVVLAVCGCTNPDRPSGLAGDGALQLSDAVVDFGPSPDAATRIDVVPVDPCRDSPCGPMERCGADVDGGRGSGNGIDDNCNGLVDEFCGCTPGEMRPCFPGARDRRGVGACTDGVARCTELAAWIGNECRGATIPVEETCNQRDDDCDGALDEGLSDCASAVACPASVGAVPLVEFSYDGRGIDPMATAYRWSLACPEGVAPCPTPTGEGAMLRVTVPRAGRYELTLESTRASGVQRCTFPMYAQGRGLRVELDWDRKGGINSVGADMDLHLAIIDRRRAQSSRWFTPDDCYFQTGRSPGGTVRWSVDDRDTRFAPSATSELCEGSPPPHGEMWRAAGRCWNPRLDVDNLVCDPAITDGRDPRFCFSENAAVDDPPDDVTFRVGVNFYRDHGLCDGADARDDVVHPVLSVSCGGLLRASVGSVDDGLVAMSCRDNPMIGSANWTWIAADIRFSQNVCGARDCRVTPLRAGAGRFTACSRVAAEGDVCQDERGRVFVRRAGARPVDVEFAETP
nr:hypothetical protein [Deltaproteobacteria bacterium]